MSIKVIVNGANGKMGKVTVDAIRADSDCDLVASLTREDDLGAAIKKHHADVVVDFTVPSVVFANSQTIIDNNARPVIGTTGLTLTQIETLQQQCAQKKLGGIIAPNFAIGAILMMKYAADAAKYVPDVEIIEMHHEKKIDAPSGTAAKTAEMIAQSKNLQPATHSPEDAARGEHYHGTHIHSVRLPGLFAHQAVMFGGLGQTLTIRHDSTDRNAMMPGVVLACHKVMQLNELVYGLENVLD